MKDSQNLARISGKKKMRILFVEFAQLQFICYNKYIFIYIDFNRLLKSRILSYIAAVI